MRVIDKAIFIEANSKNFNNATRSSTSIQYIVCHYTANIGDTARNNALYFRDTVVQASAHYFVDETNIYQSVRDYHAAYAVGLGTMKNPYFQWPSMWQKINNSNSISVEMCGSKTSREATDTTKKTAAQLVADLLDKYKLTPDRVFRHYDVTGKPCPAWAVESPEKWFEFLVYVQNYFSGKEDADFMIDTPENYALFKTWFTRYMDELATLDPKWDDEAMAYCKARGLINDGAGQRLVTRSELATVLYRMNA